MICMLQIIPNCDICLNFSSNSVSSVAHIFHALQILSDSTKKRDYDEQLRKEETRNRSVCQQPHTSHQVTCYEIDQALMTVDIFVFALK